MIKYIFVIGVTSKKFDTISISDVCYSTIEEAEEFIRNRSDNPVVTDNSLIYESSETIYRISILVLRK